MNKVWICPKCKSSSTRRSNLKAHIRNCHPGEQHEPLAYDPIIREVIPNWSPRIMHQDPPISASQLTYTDQSDSQRKHGRSLLAEQTKFLNGLSDYGDAIKRFNNHIMNPIEPAVLLSFLLSNQGQPARFTVEPWLEHLLHQWREAAKSSSINSSNKKTQDKQTFAFWGFEGHECLNCARITITFVHDFPPHSRVDNFHESNCRAGGYLDRPNQAERPDQIHENLITYLARCINSSFGERFYLYCREIVSSKYHDELVKYHQRAEYILGIPHKFRRLEIRPTSSKHWAIRSRNDRRTLMPTNELNEFLKKTNATFAVVKLTLDGRSGYYFMWIDGENPYFKLQSEDILKRLMRLGLQAIANTNNYWSH